ncbi:phosphoribosylformylglycinamidine synthase [bacterium]|nr:MAG: phosphoribosylformylglycinamidine synthase [bacterium]
MKRNFSRKVAVIQFPGVNCEYETARAIRTVGLEVGLFRWNEDPAVLDDAVAIVLPGGFSYQDRIRAGVVAAKDRVMDKVSELAAAGMPVLGICNGAQVLVESGFVPGLQWESVELALAPNIMEDRSGYYCRWVYSRLEETRTAWTGSFSEGAVIPIPIAHAEGRFVTENEKVLKAMKENGQIVLRYCDSTGVVDGSFPANPNGSMDNIAAACNREGNVVAMMPHPERATWLRQVPENLPDEWGRRRRKGAGNIDLLEGEGPGRKFFTSLLERLKQGGVL